MKTEWQSFVADASQSYPTRRQRRAPTPPPIAVGSILLVFLDSDNMLLCFAPGSVYDESFVYFNSAVRVEASNLVALTRYVDKTCFRLKGLEERDKGRVYVAQLSGKGETTSLPRVVMLGETLAVPILSLSLLLEEVEPPMGLEGEVESQPLLLSCLKSQLVGTLLLWKPRAVSCVIHLYAVSRFFRLRVNSVSVSPYEPATDSLVRRVMPSTLITISTSFIEVPPPEKSLYVQTPHLPPTAQFLVETLQCLEKATETQTPPANMLRFVLLSGPPGTGKTHSVRMALQSVPSCQLVSLQGSQIMAVGHVAEATRALDERFRQACEQEEPTLIFLDECDALVSSESVATALASFMDRITREGGGVMVVAATNRVDVIPAYLRRRFDREIIMIPPRADERLGIFKSLLEEATAAGDVDTPSDADLQELARDCVGCVPADLAAIVRQACLAHVQDSEVPLLERLRESATIVGASALRDAAMQAPPRTGWDDIAGDAGGAKKALRQAIEWPRTRKAAFEVLGLTPPRGILLHGPPGCAKTSLARAAAGAAGVAFLSLDPADVYASSFVGDAEAVVRRAFSLARAASPCILFFDEIDAIIGAHDSMNMARGSSAEARVLSTFLNEMDGVDHSPTDGVLVLGATNRPWTLDAALLRPGRLDKIIYVPPPDREARRTLLDRQTSHWPTSDGTFDLDHLADLSSSMTGAEIVGACRDAARRMLRDNANSNDEGFAIDVRYLEESLLEVKPLLSDASILDDYKVFEASHKR
jgi:SpoVK/Ycf46/Vps4 family AAA+-type ATPase